MLGLKRGIVRLLPHHDHWSILFENEKQVLTGTFSESIISIEHVGSTSIPNIPAKPIIDIMIGVKSLSVALGMKDDFETLGYVHRPSPTNNIEVLYAKGSEAKRTHYVHVVVHDKCLWQNYLCFRDRLRCNAELAQEYAKLKQMLATKYPDNRGKYSSGKADFIQQVLNTCK